jgi:hypothetical protein
MKKKGTDDLEKEFESDDELYASYDAYKALLDAGVAKTDALKRTGLTAQIVKDLEAEEEAEEKEFEDSWYLEDEEDEWKEDNFDGGDVEEWDDSDDIADDFEEPGEWDERY